MKKLLLFTLASMSLFYSCKKDDNNDPDDSTSTSTYFFKFEIDGEPKSFSSYALLNYYDAENDDFNFQGSDPNFGQLAISIYDVGELPKTYPIDSTSFGSIMFQETRLDTIKQYFSTGGFVTLNTLDKTNKTASGTFAADLIDARTGEERKVTNGSFNIEITVD